jgi:excisionase family DNA binding protein
MENKMYSVEEVADLLGLHVRTVRGYIRSGRLKAVRIGKQYRIASTDLRELTGRPEPATERPAAALVEVSSIVEIDDVDRRTADRLSTLVLSGVQGDFDPEHPLRVQVVHTEERRRMKIVVLGGAAATAEVLRLIEAVLGEAGPLGREAGDE